MCNIYLLSKHLSPGWTPPALDIDIGFPEESAVIFFLKDLTVLPANRSGLTTTTSQALPTLLSRAKAMN